ncbi:hypothetical protein NPIL_222961 [Nephila pilipes]|uniref:Uncharacterized protein n=1 Tax=Nephila pilipes TaxID=299642 RepID=A0A8X6PYR6_NEPPI|nr:hypothetical protein NPIL_222961 [Nephila pilipes]
MYDLSVSVHATRTAGSEFLNAVTRALLFTLVSAIISKRSLSIPALKGASPVPLGGEGRVARGRSVVSPRSAAQYCRVGSTFRYPEMSGRGGGVAAF